jgi:hypothetical protein
LVCIFGYLPKAASAGDALKLPRGLTNGKIIDAKKVTFNDVEAIVHIPNSLSHLIEQADGLQERGAGFHGKFIRA